MSPGFLLPESGNLVLADRHTCRLDEGGVRYSA